MLEKFLAFISEHSLCSKEDRLLVAVSGGLDSVVLTNLLINGGFKVSIAHCNFQLRGEESDNDEAFVTKLAMGYECEYFTKTFDTNKYATISGISTQMAARDLRYAWFDELIDSNSFDALVVAHHLNDSLETALFNFTKGTGIAGLRGIKLKSKKIIRPLLFASRSEIKAYADFNNIKWREDSSNQSIKYQRNFLRKEVIPLLTKINPNIEKTFITTSERLSSLERLLDKSVEEFKANLRNVNGDLFLDTKLILNTELVVLEEFFNYYGFNNDQIKSLISCIGEGLSGKVFESQEYKLNFDRNQIIISKKSVDLIKEVNLDKEGSTQFGRLTIKYGLTKDLTIVDDNAMAKLDLDKLKFPLLLRPWNEGDVFQPLGMKGKKKLSDFMIDQKIPLNLKARVFVILSNNEVVWVVGYRIDDRYKITSKTRQAFNIELTYD